MADTVTILINGKPLSVPMDATVATAVFLSGRAGFRKSVGGEPRGPLCGIGMCFECRVTVNGRAHARSCRLPCQDGMDVRTDG